MKKLMFLFVLFFAFGVFAQTTTDYLYPQINPNGWYADYSIALDSAETVWSESFNLAQVDEVSFASFPFNYGADAATADSVNISAYVYVSFDNSNWIVADTIVTITSATSVKGTANFNNVKAPYYKIKVVNNAGSKANTAYKLGLYHPMND